MELILKSNNKENLERIIALAKMLNVVIEKKPGNFEKTANVNLRNRILNFKSEFPTSFGDASEWEKRQRTDREMPFS